MVLLLVTSKSPLWCKHTNRNEFLSTTLWTDSPGDDELWDPILKRLLPGMLDLIVEANNGKLVIKKRKRQVNETEY